MVIVESNRPVPDKAAFDAGTHCATQRVSLAKMEPWAFVMVKLLSVTPAPPVAQGRTLFQAYPT